MIGSGWPSHNTTAYRLDCWTGQEIRWSRRTSRSRARTMAAASSTPTGQARASARPAVTPSRSEPWSASFLGPGAALTSDRVGVDGCRLGWVAVFAEGTQLRYRLFHRFDELVAGFPRAIIILVDIPIGLPWSGCPTRPCDTLARRRLGAGRASS